MKKEKRVKRKRRNYAVTVFPGDGIGPEVMAATVKVLEATGVHFVWDFHDLGEFRADETTDHEEWCLAHEAKKSLARTRLGLKGPTRTPSVEGHRSLNVALRKMFDLYVNVRPVKTMPSIKTRFMDLIIDMVIFRENLEDLYVGEEYPCEGGYIAISRFTERECHRVAQYAFAYAEKHGRKKVTVVHKANILKMTHGLFLRTAQEVAKEYPDFICDDILGDNLMTQVICDPDKFDCMLLPNFLGDLASDLGAGMIGKLGFAPGANIGPDCAVFEAVHGTALDIAGKNIANPTALILSGAMLLEHVGEKVVAGKVRNAVSRILEEGTLISPDGRVTSTTAFADAVVKNL